VVVLGKSKAFPRAIKAIVWVKYVKNQFGLLTEVHLPIPPFIFQSHHNNLISSTFLNDREKIPTYFVQSCHPSPGFNGAFLDVYCLSGENEMDQ
jgi:hypothetical protein